MQGKLRVVAKVDFARDAEYKHLLDTRCKINANNDYFQNEVRFVRKGQQYLTILPQEIGDTGYWNHLALVRTHYLDRLIGV